MRSIAALALLLGLSLAAAWGYIKASPVPLADWRAAPGASFVLSYGGNPAPVALVRPPGAPLSAMARLGQQIFYDKSLSASGQLSCASCHSPQNFYGPPDGTPARFGGPAVDDQGVRAVPSLMYLQDQPNFSIGPDNGADVDHAVPMPQLAAAASAARRAVKTANAPAMAAANLVPQGGLYWDGRVNTLQDQAAGPLFSPYEMDGGSIAIVAGKLQAAPYAASFRQLFGPLIFRQPGLLVAEALFAVAYYQVESPIFHPYSSKYDAWLEGKTRLSPAELRGYELFNDPAKGNCAACHVDQPSAQGQPPLFSDHQYEALGVPRNMALAINHNPAYYDMGLCGPYRTDMAALSAYCGLFLTPSLRNAASRSVFFHNGIYHNLAQVLDFYDFRDTAPAKIYPRDAAGHVQIFNDLPARFWGNIDHVDPPFTRHIGQAPALDEGQMQDIIAFMKTLTDGFYKPAA